jgi:hypothetical protein
MRGTSGAHAAQVDDGSSPVASRAGVVPGAAVRPSMYPPYEWGMELNPQGAQADGQHKAQPLIDTWRWIRAQIGNRPVQSTPRGDAGQSSNQMSGTIHGARPGGGRAMIDEGPFFFGPEVVHIQRFFRAANTGWGGVNSIGRSAPGVLSATGDNTTVLKRPLQRYPTRGPRSISGAMNAKSRWDDTGRVPSVFVPTTPLR